MVQKIWAIDHQFIVFEHFEILLSLSNFWPKLNLNTILSIQPKFDISGTMICQHYQQLKSNMKNEREEKNVVANMIPIEPLF